MANAFKGTFTALFVETSDFPNMSEEDKKRLRDNIHLAEQLGATIETVYGDDVAFQITEFARLSGVSKIVVGRSTAKRKHIFAKPTLTEKMLVLSPNLDIYVIPDKETVPYKIKKKQHYKWKFVPLDLIKSILVLCAATLIGYITVYLVLVKQILLLFIYWACWLRLLLQQTVFIVWPRPLSAYLCLTSSLLTQDIPFIRMD